MVGAEKARRKLVSEFFPAMHGLRMLDIGCGTAEILKHLPEDMEYYGFDASDDYIRQANIQFGHRATFKAELVRQASIDDLPNVDLVLAFGLLHHLNDNEASTLFELAHQALKPSGTVITIDPVYTDQQSSLARWIISKDRGQNIRTAERYQQLVQSPFSEIKGSIHHDMLNIPYSHLILKCKKAIA